jgi:hypothetical protein
MGLLEDPSADRTLVWIAFSLCAAGAFLAGCYRQRYGWWVVIVYFAPAILLFSIQRAVLTYLLFGLIAEVLIGARMAKRHRQRAAIQPPNSVNG